MCTDAGQHRARSIVGKGNHSANHIQKIKPRVEQVCQELGLQYAMGKNAGRIYINLTGGPAELPPDDNHHESYQHYPQQQQPYPGHKPPRHQQQDEIEQVVNALLPKLLRKLEKACCTLM